MYFIGVDLGQRVDRSAIAVVERMETAIEGFDFARWTKTVEHLPDEWVVRRLERIPLGMPYTEMVERLRKVAEHPKLRGNSWMAVDATGVGAPVVDMLRAAELECHLMPVILTGGIEASYDGRQWRVPKIDLLARMRTLIEQGRLKVVDKLRERPALMRELLSVRGKQARGGGVRVGADGYGEHDDLAMAVALAVWMGRKGPGDKKKVGYVGKRVV
jgi:hypothetical protein